MQHPLPYPGVVHVCNTFDFFVKKMGETDGLITYVTDQLLSALVTRPASDLKGSRVCCPESDAGLWRVGAPVPSGESGDRTHYTGRVLGTGAHTPTPSGGNHSSSKKKGNTDTDANVWRCWKVLDHGVAAPSCVRVHLLPSAIGARCTYPGWWSCLEKDK